MTIPRTASVLAGLLASLSFAQIQVAPNVVAPSSSLSLAGKVHSNHYFYTGGSSEKGQAGPFVKRTAPSGIYPAQALYAYGLQPNMGSGAIAIVVPFDLPSALQDFNTFSAQYGLPVETSTSAGAAANAKFQVVYSGGAKPASSVGWGSLAALTTEWAHAIAPGAKIYLVEAQSESLSDVYSAVSVARAKLGVHQVIMPWGTDEYGGEAADDTLFLQSGVTFFAPAGDFTGHLQYPATSPNVVGVGGTNLSFNGLTTVEVAWDSSAAGLSAYEARPAGQAPVANVVGAKRGSPDITMVGDPLTSVAVYSSFAIGGWTMMGGSSLSTAMAGAVANARGSFSASSAAEISRIYQYMGTRFFRDIVSGSAGSYTAGPGYDILSGAGSPYGLYSAVQNKTYAPSTATVEVGTLLSGSVANLGGQGGSYQIQSASVPNVGQVAQFTADIPLDRVATQMVSVNVQLNNTSVAGATESLYVYNWATSAYVLVGTYPSGSSIVLRSLPISKWSTLFSPTNVVRIRVATTVGGSATPFTFSNTLAAVSGSY